MSRPVRIALLAFVALAGLLAACGGSGASVAPATPVPSGVVTLEAREYTFTPSTVTVPTGPTTFSVKNVGGQDHQFEVFKGDAVVGGIETIAPGATADLPLTLAAGDYTFICKLNGHDQLGMKGTITVTGG